MTGKQGNTVFSSNKYGPYTCERKLPLNPQTDAQQAVRNGTANIARSWAMLTPQQRAKWNDETNNYPFKKKGITYFLTGFMFFMKLNRNLHEVKEPLMKDCPSSSNIQPQPVKSFRVEMVNTPSGIDLLLFINPSIKNKTKIILSATKPVRNSEQYGTHNTYKIAVLDNSFTSGSSIKDFYLKKYLVLPSIYKKAFFDIRSININSGFSSPYLASEVFGI